MNEGWAKFFARMIAAGMMNDFVALMQSEAMLRSRMACQIGQAEEVRRDALADVRFCLSKADEAAKALTAAKEKAKFDAARGFPEGGAAPA